MATVEGTGSLITTDGSRIDYQGTGTPQGRLESFGSFTENLRHGHRWYGTVGGLSGNFRVRFVAQSGGPGSAMTFSGRFNGLMSQARR